MSVSSLIDQQDGQKSDVLFVSSWNVPCGIATYTKSLIDRLNKLGVSCSVCELSSRKWRYWLPVDIEDFERNYIEQLKHCKIVHFQHETALFGGVRGSKFALKIFYRMIDLAKQHNRKIYITFHTDFYDFSARRGRGRLRIANIYNYYFKLNRYRKLVRLINKTSTTVIVHSEKSRFGFSKLGIQLKNIIVYHHPTLEALEFSKEENLESKRALGYSDTDIILLIFGFVSHYKGHDTIVSALKRLPKNYKLIIAGGPHPESHDHYIDELLRKIRKDKLADRVRITGWIEPNLAMIYLGCADMCLAPYRETGLSGSGALTWALRAKKPIILSRIEAFSPLAESIDGLRFVNSDSPFELAWSIQDIAQAHRDVEKYEQQIESFLADNSWENAASLYKKIYRM